MKPIIGIVGRPDISVGENLIFYIHSAITDAIIQSGGIPLVLIPPQIEKFYKNDYFSTNKMSEEEWQDFLREIKFCDKILLQGGDDFYDYDIRVVNYAYENNIPLLGICLGMQSMSFAFGGNIVKLPNEDHKKKNLPYVHEVILKNDSFLSSILNKERIMTNSRHNFHTSAPTLSIVGRSTDNVIEAIEDKNKKFFVGVQWHPENMITYDDNSKKLFEKFINQ